MSEKKPINEDQTLPVQSQFLLYQTEDGQTCIEVRLENETVWLNQLTMAELFRRGEGGQISTLDRFVRLVGTTPFGIGYRIESGDHSQRQ